MSETKWTKGPWNLEGNRDDDGICVTANGGDIAYMAATLGYAAADEANAHLIAAAPALYEALEKVIASVNDLAASSVGVHGLHLNGDVAAWSELLEGGRFEEWLGMSISQAQAALKFARGEA